MGVPKFFRYISERYPCLSELVKEKQIPEFDNLYLDMNGIIHNCSHPDDDNIHFRITEEKIFVDIFHYIDTLFRTIQPRKVFFMAVDGVAPRAKMNQQRGRRFRSAKEAETKENLARQKGENLPDTVRFDSNCITPGTAFMVRLQTGLKHFIQTKISSNPLWRRCRVILSGHETPGEGEHKIMEYIRFAKAQPGFDPNTRHCLYGLDADLVMLGLCSHELHFSLLREEVKFGSKAKKNTSVDSTRFFLLHLGMMREYLELEFVDVKERLPFGFDVDAIVDDWVLMCYLVGNDFVPNLPNFHINTNALPTLYDAYKKVLPTLGGYINEAGVLNLKRLEVFLEELGRVDREIFKTKNGNLECLRVDDEETFGDAAQGADANWNGEDGLANGSGGGDNDELRQLAQNTLDMYLGDDDEEDEAALEEREFALHKRDYYIKKMGYAEMTADVLAEQAECYVRALQWILSYYYRGVKSWCWYYPHHYAPYISDVRNFSHLRFDYEEGTPFLPFQQLLAVLPAASRAHLPDAYHQLMTSEQSSVIEYYPADFDTDLNGKKQDWEAVVLIPFIDERRLLDAMAECEHLLTADEVERNAHGPMYQYDFCELDQGARPEAQAYGLTDYMHTYCVETTVDRSELYVPDDQLVLGTSPGVQRDVHYAGFPSFRHLPYTGAAKAIRSKVFDQPSMNPSMVIKVQTRTDADLGVFFTPAAAGDDDDEVAPAVGLQRLQQIADHLIGKEIFVDWPHLCLAKVVTVSDREYECSAGDNQQKNDGRRFEMLVRGIASHHRSRLAIDIGPTAVLVWARPLREHSYSFGADGQMTPVRVWSDTHLHYPLQTVVRHLRQHVNSSHVPRNVCDIFAVGSTVFMTNHCLYYGARGTVIDTSEVKRTGRVAIELTEVPLPDLAAARSVHAASSTHYVSAQQAASTIGVNQSVFSEITGMCFVTLGAPRFPVPKNSPQVNIGLRFKFPKRGEELTGYALRQGNVFTYSPRAISMVAEYLARWPQVFLAMRNRRPGAYVAPFETDIFPEGSREKMSELQSWLKALPLDAAERRPCGSQALDEDAVLALMAAVDRMPAPATDALRLRVLPESLYMPGLADERTVPDVRASEYELFDRVVVVKDTHAVPFGLQGTVVCVHPVIDPNPIRQENQRKPEMFYDVLFDRQFDDGGAFVNVAEKRMFKMSPLHMMNITFGSTEGRKNQQVRRGDNRQRTARPTPNPSAAPSILGDLSKHSSADIWAMLKKAKTQENNANATTQNQPPPAVQSQQVPPAKNATNRQSAPTKVLQRQPPAPAVAAPATATALNAEQTAFGQLMKRMQMSAVQTTAAVANSNAVAASPAAPATEQYQKIKLEDMFRVDTASLPKPPVNWRIKCKTSETDETKSPAIVQQQIHRRPALPPQQSMHPHPSLMPQFQRLPPPFPTMPHQMPPPPLHHQRPPPSMMPPMPAQQFFQQAAATVGGRCPLPPPQQLQQQNHNNNMMYNNSPAPNRNYYQTQNHQQHQYHQQQHQYPYQHQQQQQQQHSLGPQGPQNLRQNGAGHTPRQGAFIPLQATRKQAAAKAAAAASAASASTTAANKQQQPAVQLMRRKKEDTDDSSSNSGNNKNPTKPPPTAESTKAGVKAAGPKKPANKTSDSAGAAASGGGGSKARSNPPAPKPSRIAACFDKKL